MLPYYTVKATYPKKADELRHRAIGALSSAEGWRGSGGAYRQERPQKRSEVLNRLALGPFSGDSYRQSIFLDFIIV